MEDFWSLLMRPLNGTHVSVEPFHLFRYNNRKPMEDSERFRYLVRKVVGKRLTYAQLTDKVGEKQPEAF